MDNNAFEYYPNVAVSLIDFNEELLKIMESEIVERDNLRKASSYKNIKAYYMMQEKKHIYFHPVFESTTNSIYNYPLRTERERLENPPREPHREPRKSLTAFMETLLAVNQNAMKHALSKSDQYIYKVFPNAELRLKVVCACMEFLCAEFKKFLDRGMHVISADSAMYGEYIGQLHKFLVVAFVCLQREEKCVYKKAKKCMSTLYSTSNYGRKIFPERLLLTCLQSIFKDQLLTSRFTYKRIMRVVKLFPNKFLDSFWDKIEGSCRLVLKRLGEENSREKKPLASTEWNVACFLISSYKYKASSRNDEATFRLLVEQVLELKRLIHLYGMYDSILKKPVTNLLNRYSDAAISCLKSRYKTERTANELIQGYGEQEFTTYNLLRLFSSAVKYEKTVKFKQNLAKHANVILSEILAGNSNRIEAYKVIHEVLAIVKGLDDSKQFAGWIKDQQQLVYSIARAWIFFIPILSKIQHLISHLQADFVNVVKLLISYLKEVPADVEAAYLLLEFAAYSDKVWSNRLKQFFIKTFYTLVPMSAYRAYAERYLAALKSYTAPCVPAVSTNYLMTPLLHHIYTKKVLNEITGRGLEETLLETVFTTVPNFMTVQRRLLRLGALMLEHGTKEAIDHTTNTVVMSIWKKKGIRDPEAKSWAFLSLANFVRRVALPNERLQIVLHDFFENYSAECRDTLVVATDRLVPIMFKENNAFYTQNLLLIEKTLRLSWDSPWTVASIFGMVARNRGVFKQARYELYPRMVQAFQWIFFHSQQYQHKVLALSMASTMIGWGMAESQGGVKLKAEVQVRNVIATVLFREVYSYHCILDTEDSTEKEMVELTYKCLVILKALLTQFNDPPFRIPIEENRALAKPNRVSIYSGDIWQFIYPLLELL